MGILDKGAPGISMGGEEQKDTAKNRQSRAGC